MTATFSHLTHYHHNIFMKQTLFQCFCKSKYNIDNLQNIFFIK